MPLLDRDGVRIHYEVRGQGPVVLLSHGYSATAQMWRFVAVEDDRGKALATALWAPDGPLALRRWGPAGAPTGPDEASHRGPGSGSRT